MISDTYLALACLAAVCQVGNEFLKLSEETVRSIFFFFFPFLLSFLISCHPAKVGIKFQTSEFQGKIQSPGWLNKRTGRRLIHLESRRAHQQVKQMFAVEFSGSFQRTVLQ